MKPAFLLLPFIPMLVGHFRRLWDSSQYQFFPLLIAVIFFLLIERGMRLDSYKKIEISGISLTSTLLGLLLLLASVLIDTPNVAMFAFMVLTGGFVWQSSNRTNGVFWGPWLLGWLLVQLPGFIERSITQSLQLFSSKVSGILLDRLGINHLMSGNVLHLPGQDLFVDEACSGIVSLFSIVSVGAMYVLWSRYAVMRAWILIGVGVACAILLNVLRITIIAVADQWYELDLVHGGPHTLLGIALFGVTLGVFYCCDNVLGKLLWPIPEELAGKKFGRLERYWNRVTESSSSPARRSKREVGGSDLSNGKVPQSAVVAFSILIFAIWVGRTALIQNSSVETNVAGEPVVVEQIDKRLLGEDREDVSYEYISRERLDPTGEFSKVFRIKAQPAYDLSIDYPFNSQWHELTNCYELAGWAITNRRVVDGVEQGIEPWVEVDFSNPTGQVGFLLFSLVDTEGTPTYTPDKSSLVKWVYFEMGRRLSKGLGGKTIQFQSWCPTDLELTLEQKAELTKEFLEFREAAMVKMFEEQLP